MEARLRATATFPLRCAVCGSGRIGCDSVSDGTLLHMAECSRCEHRWTWRGGEMSLARPASVRKLASAAPRREVPSAA